MNPFLVEKKTRILDPHFVPVLGIDIDPVIIVPEKTVTNENVLVVPVQIESA